ncbi:unnamed protein product [Lupinus luteus]|uniref:Uncharacterized protein n=1 Tax=Lupinus luteus TaxID=3873 RepID=A0AAV1WFN5_LUPLU
MEGGTFSSLGNGVDMASSPAPSQAKRSVGVVYPAGYGVDPTGKNDSSEAILNAKGDAFKIESGLELMPGVKDLGGVVIDLQASSPAPSQAKRSVGVVYPAGYGVDPTGKNDSSEAILNAKGDAFKIESGFK